MNGRSVDLSPILAYTKWYRPVRITLAQWAVKSRGGRWAYGPGRAGSVGWCRARWVCQQRLTRVPREAPSHGPITPHLARAGGWPDGSIARASEHSPPLRRPDSIHSPAPLCSRANLDKCPVERRRTPTGTKTLVCMVNSPLAEFHGSSGQLSRRLRPREQPRGRDSSSAMSQPTGDTKCHPQASREAEPHFAERAPYTATSENTGGSRVATVDQVAPASAEPNNSPEVEPK